MPQTRVNVTRDDDGTPVLAEVRIGGRKLEARYDRETGFQFKGSQRLLLKRETWDLLNLIFPHHTPASFTIPEPLKTVALPQGRVLMFDDFEGLYKWEGAKGSQINTFAYNGSQCLKLTCLDLDVATDVVRGFGNSPRFPKSVGCMFAIEDLTKMLNWRVNLQMSFSGEYHFVSVIYNTGTGWFYVDQDNNAVSIEESHLVTDKTYNVWHRMKLNFDHGHYLSLEVNNHLYDLKKQPYYSKVVASNDFNIAKIETTRIAGNDAYLYIDDFLISEE